MAALTPMAEAGRRRAYPDRMSSTGRAGSGLRRVPARRPLRVVQLLAVAVPVALAGCASAEDKATSYAAEQARADVEKARAGFEGVLRSTGDPERARQDAADWVGSIGYLTVTGGTVVDRQVQLDVTAIGRADATDGFSHSGTLVRVCARLTGRPGRDATAATAGLPCPPTAPTEVPSLGEVDTTVPLEP